MQAVLTEQNKLRKQLENSEHELQLQINELTNSNTEKLKLVKVRSRHFSKKFYISCSIDDFSNLGTAMVASGS